jgi:hypothetical protein
MDITKEAIESRLEKLSQERDILQNRLIQGQADLNAYNGAIIECQYWLDLLEDVKQKETISESLKP